MNEDKIARDMMNRWLAFELVSCGYPLHCPEDLKGLEFAIAQTEIGVVTSDQSKIAALNAAIDTFIEKFTKFYRDEIIKAALTLALSLQVTAQNTLAEIKGESHLEMN